MERISAAALLMAIALAGPAAAEEKAARYTMSPTEGGFLRLDTVTGAVSFCSRRNADWLCTPVADDTAKQQQQAELDRLKSRNAELEAEVKRLDDLSGPGAKPEGETHAERGPMPKLQLPTEQDVDKAMDYLSRMYRKFRDKLKEFDETDGKGTKI